jgi:hypothetical protein
MMIGLRFHFRRRQHQPFLGAAEVMREFFPLAAGRREIHRRAIVQPDEFAEETRPAPEAGPPGAVERRARGRRQLAMLSLGAELSIGAALSVGAGRS